MCDYVLNRNDLWSLSADILRSGNRLRFRAKGISMMPFIRDGELLLAEPRSEIRRGDVVLCRTGERHVVVHRVVSTLDEGICTQGDACRQLDGVIAREDVLGLIVAIERSGRARRLDRGPYRWLGLLWITLSPISRIVYRVLADLFPTRRDLAKLQIRCYLRSNHH